jgi:hypothetical protein
MRGMSAAADPAPVGLVYRIDGTLDSMATKNPRVQVTVDPALAEAMAEVDPSPKSKSRLIRDMALRGAEAAAEDRRRHAEATKTLLKIARGEILPDFTGAWEALEEREAEVE